ncbi:SKU5 similar 13 [Zea mays]|uniref:SKU5 similar 13 n=1 Tax=Zea mays TaxID=4577 RepID=A0A1D6N8K3_MAIZE|nr:SKU5 similar 13 [Zea mays]
MLGTMCPIQPNTNFTYHWQPKDQIGSFFYYPSTGMQRAAGAYGLISVHSRDLIPVPFDTPADDFPVLVGDWYTKDHTVLAKNLDAGKGIGRPAGLVINGKNEKDASNPPMYNVEAGKTYRFRVCNVGIKASFNIRIQNHIMKLVEMEGSHTMQNDYDSLDLHIGQCLSFLVTSAAARSSDCQCRRPTSPSRACTHLARFPLPSITCARCCIHNLKEREGSGFSRFLLL